MFHHGEGPIKSTVLKDGSGSGIDGNNDTVGWGWGRLWGKEEEEYEAAWNWGWQNVFFGQLTLGMII